MGDVSVAVVDDGEMRSLHARYLNDDSPTDVLSFALNGPEGDSSDDACHGEIVASVETADANAVDFGWSRDDELLLYAVHGALHLAGYDDTSTESLREMRQRETEVLRSFGLTPDYRDGRGAHAHAPSSPRDESARRATE